MPLFRCLNRRAKRARAYLNCTKASKFPACDFCNPVGQISKMHKHGTSPGWSILWTTMPHTYKPHSRAWKSGVKAHKSDYVLKMEG